MAQYKLIPTKPHRQSLIELVNNDNAATIGEPLTLSSVNLKNLRAVAAEEGIARTHAVTLENVAYPLDTVEVFYNKISLADMVSMTAADFQGWYDPDTWDEATSPALAVAALKAAALRTGVDIDAVLEDLVITRYHDAVQNRFFIHLEFASFVFATGAEFVMPKHFSEMVTVFELNGFIYDPIAPEAVVE